MKAVARWAMVHADVFHQSAALMLTVDFTVSVPSSWAKWKRDAAIKQEILPTGTPDLSNLVKLVEDALNMVLYSDDSQICVIASSKRYGENPCTTVTLSIVPGCHASVSSRKEFASPTR